MKQNELDLLHRYLDGAITPEELEALEDLLRNSAEARATLAAAQAAVEKAERDLARTQVRAPFDGRVREQSIGVGQFVSRADLLRPLGMSSSQAAVELAHGPWWIDRLVLAPCPPGNIHEDNRHEADRNKCDHSALLDTWGTVSIHRETRCVAF